MSEDVDKLHIPEDIRFLNHVVMKTVTEDDIRIKIFESFDYVYPSKTVNGLARVADRDLLGRSGVIKKHMKALEGVFVLESQKREPGYTLTSFGLEFRMGLQELRDKTKPYLRYIERDPLATVDDKGFEIAYTPIDSIWFQDLRLLSNPNRWVVAQRLVFNDQPLSTKDLADSLPKVPPAAFRQSLLSLQGRIITEQEGVFTATPYARDLVTGLVVLGADTYEDFLLAIYQKISFRNVDREEIKKGIRNSVTKDALLEPTHFGVRPVEQLPAHV